MASRFAVAWWEQPAGCLTGSWFWESYEADSPGAHPVSVAMGSMGARRERTATMPLVVLQHLVGAMASLNPAAVLVARGGAHA